METNRKTAREKHMHIETEMISERESASNNGEKMPRPSFPAASFPFSI